MADARSGPIVLGASGQVGVAVLRHAGDGVVPCARRVPTWAGDQSSRWRTFDLWTHGEAPDAETVISVGPLAGCVDWLSRCGVGRARRIVALSSMSALHKQHSPSPQEQRIAAQLREAEERLVMLAQRHGVTWAILRPTLIWGVGMDRSLTPFANAAQRRGFAVIPGAATGLRQPVRAEDLAALCLAVARDDTCIGIFPAGGGERLSMSELLTRVTRSVGAYPWRVPMPQTVMRLIGRGLLGLGSEHGAALVRALDDQIAPDDALWQRMGLRPRGFEPAIANWHPPRSVA